MYNLYRTPSQARGFCTEVTRKTYKLYIIRQTARLSYDAVMVNVQPVRRLTPCPVRVAFFGKGASALKLIFRVVEHIDCFKLPLGDPVHRVLKG